ncbi:MAG: hypothetical protein ABI383_08940 [Acidobacteriaceae bacterium]
MRKLPVFIALLAILPASLWASDDTVVLRPNPVETVKSGVLSLPSILRYSGYLTDSQGNPVIGSHSVTAVLYTTQQGGSPLWQETQQITTDASGHYSLLLGVTTPGGVPLDLFLSGEARWIAVQSPDSIRVSRALLASVPYALKAHDADSVGGIPASQLMRINPDLNTQTMQAQQNTGVTPDDLQTEALLRQQADAQVLQVAEKYTDNAISNFSGGALNQAFSAATAEQIRAKQSEQGLNAQTQAEAARAQASENLLGVQIAAVAATNPGPNSLPQGAWIVSASPSAPAGYMFTGLTMQATGSPTPEAALQLGSGAQSQTTFNLYVYMKAN